MGQAMLVAVYQARKPDVGLYEVVRKARERKIRTRGSLLPKESSEPDLRLDN